MVGVGGGAGHASCFCVCHGPGFFQFTLLTRRGKVRLLKFLIFILVADSNKLWILTMLRIQTSFKLLSMLGSDHLEQVKVHFVYSDPDPQYT